jgi:adenylate kinase family enzyme
VRRVAIVGPSGAGKTTLAQHLAAQIDGDVIDLDPLYHGPDWTRSPVPEFRGRVAEATTAERWVVAGNYSQVIDIVHGRSDTIVWLDLPRSLCTWRVMRRSLGRVLRREELWNGNRETCGKLLSRDETENPVMWAWTQHGQTAPRYQGFLDGTFWDHADVHRLSSTRDVRSFLAVL